MGNRKSVCFISDNNTCRSIIAEVYLRSLAREHFEVHSFGMKADRVNYLVANVLKQRGQDPNYSFSKVYEVIENQKFDYFILMNQELKEVLPAINYDHELIGWDIPKLALDGDDEEQLLKDLNTLCDKIEDQVKTFISKYKS